ncbi:hypothetical protein [Effusibacillus dendaii]|uniref:Uncharacterized protein n=1 Tax=Effusibacillus dendaii TaxID=2743772 RepID=A0A7I8DA14_9BACL|nr:hypothetical protein [Effusibacillus dendaii]BCJ85666.1 hypothetical protein skT53_06510 [Effusibacillus dendaii]
MTDWIHQHRRNMQWGILIGGFAFVVGAIYYGYWVGQWNISSIVWKGALQYLSKPAEFGIYLLLGTLFLRWGFKRSDHFKALTKPLMPFLRAIHIPLALVVFASSTLHGLLFLRYQWKNDFHSWTGIIALGLMAGVGAMGSITFKMKKPLLRKIHLRLAVATFILILVHIATA